MSDNQVKTRKKVLMVITKSNFGGAQRYVFDLATSIPKNLFDVVVAFGGSGELDERLKKDGIRTIQINSLQRDVNLFKDVSVYFELIKIFSSEKPDVVHLNSSKMGGVGTLAAKICRVPKVIFTAHGWAFNEKRNFISKAIITVIQWFTVLLADVTIAVSQKTADQISSFLFVNKKKIKVIYNGIGEVQFLEKEEARRALLGDQATQTSAGAPTTWIGTISELHSNKGLDNAIFAFNELNKKFPNAIFVIIGEGQEKENLKKQIFELNLQNKVFLTGSTPEAKKYLKAFDIFTLTSRTEALPYVILEAGLAELPIIATEVGGIPEIINQPNLGILVPPSEALPIAEALEECIINPEYAKTLGQNLKKRIISEFSSEKMYSETFAQY